MTVPTVNLSDLLRTSEPVNRSVFCGNHPDASLGEAQTAMSMPIRLANRSDRAGRLFVPQYKHSSGRVVNKSADLFWEITEFAFWGRGNAGCVPF